MLISIYVCVCVCVCVCDILDQLEEEGQNLKALQSLWSSNVASGSNNTFANLPSSSQSNITMDLQPAELLLQIG